MLSQASIRPSGEYAGGDFVRYLQSANCARLKKNEADRNKTLFAA